MEEVQPISVSESNVLAPEEVFAKNVNPLKGDTELTQQDRDRIRKRVKQVNKKISKEKEQLKKQQPNKKLSKKEALKQISQSKVNIKSKCEIRFS